jgi:hypothetical protein
VGYHGSTRRKLMPSNLHQIGATLLNSSSTVTFIIYASPTIEGGVRSPLRAPSFKEEASFSSILSWDVPLLYGNSNSCKYFLRTEAANIARRRGQLVVVDVSTEGDGGRYLLNDRAGVRYVRVAGVPTSEAISGLGVLIAMWLCPLICKFIEDGCTVLVHCDHGFSR